MPVILEIAPFNIIFGRPADWNPPCRDAAAAAPPLPSRSSALPRRRCRALAVQVLSQSWSFLSRTASAAPCGRCHHIFPSSFSGAAICQSHSAAGGVPAPSHTGFPFPRAPRSARLFVCQSYSAVGGVPAARASCQLATMARLPCSAFFSAASVARTCRSILRARVHDLLKELTKPSPVLKEAGAPACWPPALPANPTARPVHKQQFCALR